MAARASIPGLADLTFDPHRPLGLWRVPGPLTLAVVSIAWLRGRTPPGLGTVLARHLSPDEAAYVESLRFHKRRVEWLAGRLAVKHAVRAHLLHTSGAGPALSEVRVSAVPSGIRAGAPRVDLPVEISIAHSGDFALAGCGPRPLGVDLERSREMAPLFGELLAVDAEAGRDDGAWPGVMSLPLRWACKEAVLKSFGFGLRVDTREVRLTGWHSDGRFSWRAGPELRRRAGLDADDSGAACWARDVAGYAVAIVRH